MSVNISFANSYITPATATKISEISGYSSSLGFGQFFTVKSITDNVITAANWKTVNVVTKATQAGVYFLLHHTLCKSTSPSDDVKANLGKYELRRVTAISGNDFTLDKAPDLDLDNFYVQGVVLQEFENLTLNSGDVLNVHAPDSIYYRGGILAIRVSDTLTLNGGHISSVGKGISSTYIDYRPWTPQEMQGTYDSSLYSGCENSICKDHLPLSSYGDGIIFLIAKNIVVTDSSSRIGNPNLSGVQYCRGASDSKATHDGTIFGGSTIFIACNNFTGFNPAIISKYKSGSNGKGVGRAYIATGGLIGGILADEGLYALDSVQNSKRLNSALNVRNFGRGEGGNGTNTSSLLATYSVSAVSADKKTFTCSGVSTVVGRLVLVHQLQKSAGANLNSGKFYLARIESYNSTAKTMTLDFACDVDPANYYVQIMPLKEFEDLTINGTVKGQAWSGGTGGILPIVCNGTLNLCGGFLDVRGCGTKSSISNTLVGNNFMRSRLYIGQGHGTVFILARNILMNANTRIGSNNDGAIFGGTAYQGNARSPEGGYSGKDGYYDDPNTSGSTKQGGTGGWGGGAGTAGGYPRQGGWHGNAPGWNNYDYDKRSNQFCSLQGAHILIVSDSIDGFNLHAISTGGEPGDARAEQNDGWYTGRAGGAGYGGSGCGNFRSVNNAYNYAGAGGYRGGGAGTPNHSITREGEGKHIFFGGGGAGCCFVYANKVTNQDATGIVTS